MPIKFVDLLQQSWNFMRNQSAFSLFAVGMISALQLVLFFFVPQQGVEISQQMEPEQLEFGMVLKAILPTILLSIINLFISLLIILNIKSINNGSYQHFFQNTNGALKAFFPILLLTILMVMPLSVGVSFAVASNMSILAFPLVILGFYLFIKLSLVIYVYLLEQPKSLFESVKFTMQLSRGKMMPLILFCVISYIIPGILGRWIAAIGSGIAGSILSIILSAMISVFMAIFTFRFYQVYRQLSENN